MHPYTSLHILTQTAQSSAHHACRAVASREGAGGFLLWAKPGLPILSRKTSSILNCLPLSLPDN